MMPDDQLFQRVRACALCADRFAATATAHLPRPVLWLDPGVRIVIAGQAPGARVHASGKPFDDPSGVRLRNWLGLEEQTFWHSGRIGFLPMAFCFPGYDARGADLPPPPLCAATWRRALLDRLGDMRLLFLIGGHAQRWHLGAAATRGGVTATVAGWRSHAPAIFPLPHPSWRNTGWLKQNPWFEAELLPVARARLTKVLTDD